MSAQRQKTRLLAACLAVAAALALPGAALCEGAAPASDQAPTPAAAPAAAPAPASRIDGDLPAWPSVTLSLEDATAVGALDQIARQLGLGFVAPKGAGPEQRIALSLQDRPGREALEAVLGNAGMRASIRGGMLIVSSDQPVAAPPSAPPAPGVSPVPAAPEPSSSLKIAVSAGSEDGDDEGHRGRRRHRDGGGKEIVRMGEPVRVEAGEVVDEAVAVGGPLTVAGHVLGDAVAVGGPVTLEPTAVVDGDLVSVGGKMDVQPGAVVGGDRVSIGGPFGGLLGPFIKGAVTQEIPAWQLAALGVLASLFKCAVLLLVGLLVITFLPDRYARVREQLVRRPGRSALTGLVMFLAFIPLCIVLAVTVIGIPLIPVAVLILVVLMAVGMTAFIAWLGDRVPLFRGRKSQFGAMALGALIVFLVMLVPVVGAILLAAAAFVSAGAALLSRFGAPPKNGAPANGAGAPASPA